MIRPVLLTLLTVSLLLTGIYLLTPRAALNAASTGSYLDAHAHIAGVGAGGSGCYVHPDRQLQVRFLPARLRSNP